MKENRVYGNKVDINSTNTKEFYDQRALKVNEMACPYTAVLLGDQDAQYADQWNKFECQYILPKMKLNKNNRVVDIGCGMGRWAEVVIPEVNNYYGTDFSSQMIKVAEERCKEIEGKAQFINKSFQEFVSSESDAETEKFDRVIIGGVCMYINDNDLANCYNKLLDQLDDQCIMYLTETVAVETRLTLDECPSQALKTTYDAIYRTTKEYNDYYKIFLDAGFKIVEQDYLPHLNKEKDYSETDRWYTIFERV